MKRLILAFFAPLILSLPAHALFEIRAGYGLQTSADENSLNATGALGTVAGFNADAIFELPLFPLGLGLRYEMLGFDYEQAGISYESDFTRLSLVANYRIIDFFAYLGIIGTVGIQNDLQMSVGGIDADFDNSMTFTVGAEGGVSLGLFMVGAELGYFIGGDFETNSTSPLFTNDKTLDIDGVYAKVIVGVGF